MEGHRPEVADVFRAYGRHFTRIRGRSISVEQRRALRDITACRTRALGGHVLRCDDCGHERIAYNSCRNRHCPKCQAANRAQWLEARERELLDVPYFHVVFTLPEALGFLALQNRREVYGILFQAASETLQILARDPKHLGAEIGFLAILHTWGQNLHHHPHLHCVVPGGGIGPGGHEWVSCRDGFFLPVRVLSRMFRGKFLARLQQAYDRREIGMHGRLAHLTQPDAWRRWTCELRSRPWVVYAKPPFGGPRQVLKYLARYTHRVAISNERIVSIEDGKITFRWKDYSEGNRRKLMTLDAMEFIRRFLLHVLPKGFTRIRYYGFLSNRDRRKQLERARNLLKRSWETTPVTMECSSSGESKHEDDYGHLCPECKRGRLEVISILLPRLPIRVPASLDTS